MQYVTEDKSIYKLIETNTKCDESTAESSEDSEEIFEIGELRDVVVNKIQSQTGKIIEPISIGSTEKQELNSN